MMKLQLLLQRSFRYAIRQRICSIFPTIFFEILFPTILIFLLLFIRYASNVLIKDFAQNPTNLPEYFNRTICSQQLERTSRRCFQKSSFSTSKLIFQPKNDEIDRFVDLVRKKSIEFGCDRIQITSETLSDDRQREYLQNETIIVNFQTTNNLRTERKLNYQIFVQMSNRLMKFEPIDYSFLWFSHPNLVSQTSIFPEFADLKIFLDNLLIDFQLNKTFEYQLTQRSISCPPFRRDFLFESSPISVILVLILIDFVFLIP